MGNRCPKCQFDNPPDTLYCGRCATPLPSPKDIPVSHTKTLETPKEELTTGSTFAGRYQIIEELGKGGMGKVYKVHDTEIKEKVALKLLKSEIDADEKTIERFRNEIRLARKIVHKNVGRMYDLGKTEGCYFITMEYVPGQDLRGLIRQTGQLTVGKAISIASQVCEGLTEAHRLGVVHRDLKPSNIMIDKEGNVRIMDFGIARSLKAKGITGAGVMIGTPEYMSPEQVEAKDTDQRADIYSLGVILYEMVTGRVPFEGDTPLSIAVQHRSDIPKDPRKLNTQIPEDLSRMILKCLEKDKEKRCQSAGELRSELTRIEKGIPTTERVAPKRKPITSKEITVTFRLKKLYIPALVFIALIAAGVVILKLLPKKQTVPIPAGKPSLAIIYFENNTGDESLDHWRKAIAELLITDLSQSKYIKVLARDRLFNILNRYNLLEAKSYSSEDLKKVANRGGINHILQGGYVKAGETFRINYALQNINSGKLLGSDSLQGRGEESIFSMVDELTRRIKANFKLSAEEIARDIDKDVGVTTTSSPEAFKYYSQGRKYINMGNDRQSIQFMEKAITVDPEFAMAYRSMAASYENLGYFFKAKKYSQKAFELSDRLSDRERYLIQGDFYRMSEETYGKTIEAYNKLLELYPEDKVGNLHLGLVYVFLEQWDKAIEQFEVNIQNKEEAFHSYMMQAFVYMAKGSYNKAREVLEYYLNNVSDNGYIHYMLAGYYLFRGKYDFAFVELDKAFTLNPAFYSIFLMKGGIYIFRDDLIEAEKEYLKLMEVEEQAAHLFSGDSLGALYLLQGRFEQSMDQLKQGIELAEKLDENRWNSYFHLNLAYLYQKSRNYEKVLEECEKAWNIAVEIKNLSLQIQILHFKGLSYLERKSMDEAQKAAVELNELIEKGMNRKHRRYYLHLIGMIELERENFSEAMECFKKAISLLPSQYIIMSEIGLTNHALFINSLALTYYRAKDLEKAKEQYEKTTLLTTGRLWNGDTYAKSFYMLGKIFEEQGLKAKAIEHYQKFLSLWKDADPGIVEVENAKKRLAGLKGQ